MVLEYHDVTVVSREDAESYADSSCIYCAACLSLGAYLENVMYVVGMTSGRSRHILGISPNPPKIK
jgi:hypothetical protein